MSEQLKVERLEGRREQEGRKEERDGRKEWKKKRYESDVLID